MGLDVSVADSLRMDVGEGAEELVDVELHLEYRHRGLHLVEKTRRSINGLRNELLHEVEVDFVFLSLRGHGQCGVTMGAANGHRHGGPWKTHPLSVRVVECFQLDDVGMSDNPHDLQLTVLCRSARMSR